MKKLLFVALVGTFVACGEAADTTETTETTVIEAPAPDTTVLVVPDTTVVADTTTPAPAAQ